MKRFLTLALVLVPLLSMAQDDLYFTSSKKVKEAAQKRAAASMSARTETVVAPAVVDYHSNTRSEDEYNRRYVYDGQYPDESLDARIDTVGIDDVQPRYDMNDPELDYRYSRRIVRFHSPRLYALTSPYYWDLYYGYGAWDYLYDPWDPWYWHYGWSYGWTWGPWDCWYGSIWGWSRPYGWTYWGWGPSWSRPVYYTTYHRDIVPREFNSSRGHMAAGNRIRTNAAGGSNIGVRTTTNALSSRTSANRERTSTIPTRAGVQSVRGNGGTRANGTSYTDYTNARTGRTATATNQGTRTQVYNAAREGAARRSTIGNNTYQPARSSDNQNSSNRTTVQPQTRTQQPQTRTQQTTTVQPQTRTQQTTTVQPQTRTYTPATTTRSSSTGSIGGGSIGGGGTRGGGSFGGGGGGRSGGGRR